MKTVMLRNVEVGCGKPKVIVPIVAATAQGILEKAREFRAHALDVVEWRVDFYEDVFQLPKVLSTLKGLREILGETPILFTFRTRKEGGEKEIDMEAYTALNTAVAQSGDADAVDVEVFSGDEVVRRNIQAIHAAGKAVVGSNHDFGGTPDKADLLFRLRKMQELGADIPKIAVMPRCPGDVIALLDATQEGLRRGIAAAVPGNRIGDIGWAVQSYVEQFGFGVVKEYVGHGVGQNLHEDPEVPNYGRPGHGTRLVPGMVIAIEPMINMGTPAVRVLKNQWTVVTQDGKPSAHFENTIAITENGPVILTKA